MTNLENRPEKDLHQLVVIGMSLVGFFSLFSILTSSATIPSNFPMKHPVALMQAIGVCKLLMGLFVLLKLDQHKNWARRLVIALFIFGLPMVPSSLSLMKTMYFSKHPVLIGTQMVLMVVYFLFNLALVAYLFKPDIRSLFTSMPPKLSRQILLGGLLLGVGVLEAIAVRRSNEPQSITMQQPARTAPSNLNAAEAATKIRLPNWGEIGKVERFWGTLNAVDVPYFALRSKIQNFLYPRRGFAIAPYLAPEKKMRILLFVADEGADDRLEPMLIATDKWVRMKRTIDANWSINTFPDAKLWTALIPETFAEKVLSVNSMALSTQELHFPNLPGYSGAKTRLERNGLFVTVLAYQRGAFDESRFKEFLEALTSLPQN